jgi:hypothetical protein
MTALVQVPAPLRFTYASGAARARRHRALHDSERALSDIAAARPAATPGETAATARVPDAGRRTPDGRHPGAHAPPAAGAGLDRPAGRPHRSSDRPAAPTVLLRQRRPVAVRRGPRRRALLAVPVAERVPALRAVRPVRPLAGRRRRSLPGGGPGPGPDPSHGPPRGLPLADDRAAAVHHAPDPGVDRHRVHRADDGEHHLVRRRHAHSAGDRDHDRRVRRTRPGRADLGGAGTWSPSSSSCSVR